ncbi:MAG: hypothetical protein HY064_04595 [Bacteroidetes bacterium]|nr:hypothetical protein [Bacteroidota bacterium]
MRIVGNIPHPDMSITVFHMNDKFIVKFEAGMMEQVYKFPQEKFGGMDAIREAMNETFLKKVKARFNEMFLDMKGLGL